MEQRQWLAAIAIANLVAGVSCAVAGAIFLISRNPDITLDTAGMPRIFVFVLMPLLIANSRPFSGALLLLLSGALLASALGIWRRDPGARKLEIALLWGAVVVFSGSGGMGLVMGIAGGAVLLLFAAACGWTLWRLHQPETRASFGEAAASTPRARLVTMLLCGLAVAVLGFGWLLMTMMKALRGLH